MRKIPKMNEKTKVFTLLAALSFQLLPELLRVIVLYAGKRSLGNLTMAFCTAAGAVAGIACLLPAFAFQFREAEEKNRGVTLRFLLGMLPVLCFYFLYRIVETLLWPRLQEIWYQKAELLLIVLGIVALVFLVVKGYAYYAWVQGCRRQSWVRPLREFIRHPFCGLGVIVSLGLAEGIPVFLEYAAGKLSGQKVYALSSLLLHGAAGILQGLCLMLVLCLVLVSFSGKSGETEERQFLQGGRRWIAPLVFGAVAVGLLIVQTVTARKDPVEQVCQEIEENLENAGLEVLEGDVEGSLACLHQAQSVVEIWNSALELGDAGSAGELKDRYPNNSQAEYFWCLKQQNPEQMEIQMRTGVRDPRYGIALLDLYGEMEELSEEQKAYRDEILSLCAGAGVYQNPYLLPRQMESRKERLKFRFKEYAGLEEQTELMEQAAAMMREGTATRELVDQALSLAEKYPGNWTAQYLAAVAGSSLTYDGAGHYERTIQAAAEYVRLYQEASELSEEEVCALKLKTADMMVKCYGYKEALPYLEDVIAKGKLSEAFTLASQCYERLEEYEKTYELCKQMLEKEPEHVTARYYAAVNALKMGDVEESLKQTVELARLAREGQNDPEYVADETLYNVLQMLAFNDNSQYTGYQYAVYEDLTEEQRSIVKQEPFLADYLDAVYECFVSREEGHNEQALDLVEKVLDANEQLPQAWYLKGTILFHMESYQEASEAFRHSLAQKEGTPAVWYALANAYDGMEEYELAYEAGQRALALLPEQDHGSDWYGISIHCGNLVKNLEKKLEGGN